jgi:hypothetical protein
MMYRSRSNEPRDRAVTVILTKSERGALEELSAKWERSISWIVGSLALEASSLNQSHRARVVSKHD